MGTPFMSEVKICAFNFPPKGWAFCNGQFLPINQNQALFSLLGTMYGGNGQTTFALPDLRGRASIHIGAGFTQGQAGGQEVHTLTHERDAESHPFYERGNRGREYGCAERQLARPIRHRALSRILQPYDAGARVNHQLRRQPAA